MGHAEPLDATTLEALLGGLAAVALSDREHGLDELLPEERACVADAHPKRQREFAAGRVCAHRLLERRGVACGPLLSDADRVPCWPAGVVGSITHSGGLCAVALAGRDSVRALGLDLEVEAAVRRELWRRICRPAEIERLAALPDADAVSHATAVFSAKEATYKCLFPETRVPLGFRDVEVELDLGAGRFVARFERPAEPLVKRGGRLEGRIARDSGWVVSALLVPAAST